MKAESLKGMAVVSIDTAARLGRVEDLAFDPQELRLAALRVNADGQHALIPFERLQSIGKDAVTVPDDTVAQWVKPEGSLTTLPGLDTFKKLKVVDESGTFVGAIHEIDLDPQTGRVIQFETRHGGVFGIGGTTTVFPVGDVRSVGTDVMVVRAPATTD